jgi:predicted helicase
MLVQHLLTERIFRKVFDDPEFLFRNVIATAGESRRAPAGSGRLQLSQMDRVS